MPVVQDSHSIPVLARVDRVIKEPRGDTTIEPFSPSTQLG